MKALSIKPPWAYFIIYGIPYGVAVDNSDGSQHVVGSGRVIMKDIENRNWPILSSFHLPQRIQVHAGKKDDDFESVFQFCVGMGLPAFSIMAMFSSKLPHGAIIGEVDIVGCVTESASPWFMGKYGFVLRNPVAYPEPIPCRGKLGFFEPEIKDNA